MPLLELESRVLPSFLRGRLHLGVGSACPAWPYEDLHLESSVGYTWFFPAEAMDYDLRKIRKVGFL